MRKLLIICGPTATGKTNIGLRLAKKFNGEVISADSRQVYKGLDIGTGKDIPNGFKFKLSKLKLGGREIGYYTDNIIRVWGYDIVHPNDDFSVSDYSIAAKKIIDNVYSRGKLPIITGGTGFYIKSITEDISTLGIPKLGSLRESLKNKQVKELYEILAVSDPTKAANLNKSDRKNPRRLVRAIEVSEYLKNKKVTKNENSMAIYFDEVLKVGLMAPKDVLSDNIKKRVQRRIKIGFENEFKSLVESGARLNSQAFLSLGYRQWKEFITGKQSKNETVERWIKEEQKYAKRQMTWFKRDKSVKWFDTTSKTFPSNLEKFVGEWYSLLNS